MHKDLRNKQNKNNNLEKENKQGQDFYMMYITIGNVKYDKIVINNLNLV